MITNSQILQNTTLKSSGFSNTISLGTNFKLDPNKNILYYIKDGQLAVLVNSDGLISDNSKILTEIKTLSLESLDEVLGTESIKANDEEINTMLTFFRNFNICRSKIDKESLKNFFDSLIFTSNRDNNEKVINDFINKNIGDFDNIEYFGNLISFFESKLEEDVFEIENFPKRYSYDLSVYCFYPKLAYLIDDIGFKNMKEVIQSAENYLSKLTINFETFRNSFIKSLSKELFSYENPTVFSNNRRAPSNSFFVINSNEKLLGTESNDFILALLNNSLNKFNSVDMLDKFLKLFAQKTVEVIKKIQAEYLKDCKEKLNRSFNYFKASVFDIISLGLSSSVYATKLAASLLKLGNDAMLYEKAFNLGINDLSIYYGAYNTYEIFKELCESDKFLIDTLEKEKFVEFVGILSKFFNDSATTELLKNKLEPTFDCIEPMRESYKSLFNSVKDDNKYNILYKDIKEE